MDNLTIGFALTGSFCTHADMLHQIRRLKEDGANIVPIVSTHAGSIDTRFGTAADLKKQIFEITGVEPLDTIVLTEPFGPKIKLDALVIAPCTGNTLAKLANAITDTPVTMAAKAHLRNERPLVLAIATNDGLSGNAQNIGALIARKNVYFVPFGQDDPVHKPSSLVSHPELISETVQAALRGKQLQPVLRHW